MRKNLAVAMIVKNEELNLPKCVESFRKHGLNPDFYLTDTGSTDSTFEVAKNLGCSIVQSKQIPIKRFHEARNESLSNVIGDYKWLMTIDADEELDENLSEEIKNFIENPDSYDNYDAAWIHNTGFKDVCYNSKLQIIKQELFMNGTVEYKYNLHEEFDRDNLDKSRIKDLYGYLWHYSLQERDNSLENEIRKQEWYISIARNFVNEEPENWYPYYILACQMSYYLGILLEHTEYLNKIDKNELIQEIKENFENAFVLAFKTNPEKVEYRFLIRSIVCYKSFLESAEYWRIFFNSYKEYQDYLLSLIFRAFQEFPIHPIQVIYLAEIYLNRNNPNDTRKALYWLEILDKLERPRYEDLFGMTDRLVNEVPLEMLMMSSWNSGKKKESLMYYMRLQEVNPENYLVKENRSWFETYKFILN